MINMMNDILQYLPYALITFAALGLLLAGFIYTFNYFRKENQRLMRFPSSKRDKSAGI